MITPVDSMKVCQIYICDNILIENKDLEGKKIQRYERHYCLLRSRYVFSKQLECVTADPSTADYSHCSLKDDTDACVRGLRTCATSSEADSSFLTWEIVDKTI